MSNRLEELLVESIITCLNKSIGRIAAAAINFQLDPRLAVRDQDAYAARLLDLSGPASNIILRKIEDLFCKKIGLKTREWASLSECVTSARDCFIAPDMVA